MGKLFFGFSFLWFFGCAAYISSNNSAADVRVIPLLILSWVGLSTFSIIMAIEKGNKK